MKKKLQQWAALCLTLALAFCLALPVWADEPTTYAIGEDQKGKITLTWNADDTESNTVTATAYKVIQVDYDYEGDEPMNPEFYWVDEVKGWVHDNYSTYITSETDSSVPESFKDVTGDSLKNFVGAMSKAVRDGTSITGLTEKTVKSSGGNLILTDLEMGAYLILLEGGTKIYEPVFVSIVPTWNKGSSSWELNDLSQSATVKSQPLTLTKTVYDKDYLTTPLTGDEYQAGIEGTSKYAKVSIGDTVTYMLVADVPDYPADATATGYQISDDLPSGMTLNNASVQVYGMATGSPNTEAGTRLTAGTGEAYTLTTPDATRPGTGTTSVDFNLEFDYSKIKNYDKIRVVYTATANSNIYVVGQNSNTTGNQNTAYLDYNNNPYEVTPTSWETDDDTATVYSYGIKVNKVNDKRQALSDAKFTLSTNQEGTDKIQFIGTAEGTYRKAKSGESGVTEIEVDSNGLLTLSGLDVGTYYLTETKAPGGYNKLSAPILVEIKDLKNGIADAEPKGPNGKPEYIPTTPSAAETEADDGYVPLTVVNSQGFTLPSTGGMGTVLFTAIGIVLMGGGLVLLLLYLRRRNRA